MHSHPHPQPLNGRGGGADLKRNALQDGRIALNVAASLAEHDGSRLLRNVLKKVGEEDDRAPLPFCTAALSLVLTRSTARGR